MLYSKEKYKAVYVKDMLLWIMMITQNEEEEEDE